MNDALQVMIDVDLPCVACAYNLRGLSVDGNCPECGHSVLNSSVTFRSRWSECGTLVSLSPKRLMRIRFGLSLAIASWWASMAAGALVDMRSSVFSGSNGVSELMPVTVAFVFGIWAAWHVTTPEPNERRINMLRLAVLVSLLAPAVRFLNDRWLAYYFAGHVRPKTFHEMEDVSRFVAFFGGLAWMASLVTPAFVLLKLASLARLGNRRALASGMVITAILCVPAGLIVEMAGVYGSLDAMLLHLSPIGTSAIPALVVRLSMAATRVDGMLASAVAAALPSVICVILFVKTRRLISRAIQLSEWVNAGSQSSRQNVPPRPATSN